MHAQLQYYTALVGGGHIGEDMLLWSSIENIATRDWKDRGYRAPHACNDQKPTTHTVKFGRITPEQYTATVRWDGSTTEDQTRYYLDELDPDLMVADGSTPVTARNVHAGMRIRHQQGSRDRGTVVAAHGTYRTCPEPCVVYKEDSCARRLLHFEGGTLAPTIRGRLPGRQPIFRLLDTIPFTEGTEARDNPTYCQPVFDRSHQAFCRDLSLKQCEAAVEMPDQWQLPPGMVVQKGVHPGTAGPTVMAVGGHPQRPEATTAMCRKVSYSKLIYCQAFSHATDGRLLLFLVFNTGEVQPDTLWLPEAEAYFERLFAYAEQFKSEVDHVVLAGHSMGCSVALRLAWHIFERHREAFEKRYRVVGSAPFAWMWNESEDFAHLPNVDICVNAQDGKLDVVVNDRDEYYHYYPMRLTTGDVVHSDQEWEALKQRGFALGDSEHHQWGPMRDFLQREDPTAGFSWPADFDGLPQGIAWIPPRFSDSDSESDEEAENDTPATQRLRLTFP